ncbi:hypothetical protein Aperf_G00000085661 [Anoplocephala perfoliata]
MAYKERLVQSISQLKSIINSNPGFVPFSGSRATETQMKIERAILDTLSPAIDAQIHLENLLLFLSDDFAGEESNQALLYDFNKALNSLYFSLPMQLIWGVLVLTRKMLKKGFANAELIECGASCWNKATSYPQALIDDKIRVVFRITIPTIVDALLLAKDRGNLAVGSDHFSGNRSDTFDPKVFTLNLTQLTAYVLAAGCLSFSENAMDDRHHSFQGDCEMFWSLILGTVFQIPGGNPDTISLILDEISTQSIEDWESDTGKLFPALIIVATSIISCSTAENSMSEDQGQLINVLFGLYKCILRAGFRRFQQLPSIFAFECLATFASVWFPLLPNLELQQVVRSLSESFENGCRSLEQPREALEGTAYDGHDEEGLALSARAERFASFVGEQLITLPTKLEVPASSLFFQSDPFRINLLRMLTLVVRLDKIFLNRICLGRFVDTVISLLTDSRCEASGTLLSLLRILNACLLMADENALGHVTPQITEQLNATKVAWLYSQAPLLRTTSILLLEEICVLGALLMFGEGPNRLYTSIIPYRTSISEEIYCPIFAIPDVLLRAVRGETVAMISQRACCSAALLLLHAPQGLQMGPWPSYRESPNCEFYLKLLTALYSNLMDATLKPLQLLLSSLLGRALHQGSQEMLKSNASKRGPLFGDSVWNQTVLESLQLQEVHADGWPCSTSLLVFLAELLSNTPKLLVTRMDPKLLQDLVVFYAQQPADPIPPGSAYTFLQRIVDNLSSNEAVTFLSATARKCIREKLHMEGYAPQAPEPPPLEVYKRFLFPELLTPSR